MFFVLDFRLFLNQKDCRHGSCVLSLLIRNAPVLSWGIWYVQKRYSFVRTEAAIETHVDGSTESKSSLQDGHLFLKHESADTLRSFMHMPRENIYWPRVS